ncbi:MAG: GNAT family N-acetyltransferase [Bacteroidetes bacterium]|nr:GNAT family N-acetyltransferase [Bacteroidota bacterium]
MEIRPFLVEDWPAVWGILEPAFRAGTTYVFSPDISEEEARRFWVDTPSQTFVAVLQGTIVGTYFIKPNQPGLGSHVCNCGYVVDEMYQGRGIASTMCEHSQKVAVEAGFRAMQFNFVVSTNTGAIRLWNRLGFETIGVLQGAFAHPQLGDIDALVMYKKFAE